jgi:hypothetical protein
LAADVSDEEFHAACMRDLKLLVKIIRYQDDPMLERDERGNLCERPLLPLYPSVSATCIGPAVEAG